MWGLIKTYLMPEPRYRFDFNGAKQRCRILLIDDDPIALPVKEITKDGYSIVQHLAVDANLLKQCESGIFDIIVLDYNGIAPASITPNDGFGIFDRIRNANPEQYIISVSGQTYDISKTPYFKQANDWLKKPTDLAATKDALDTGIRFLFDKTEILNRLRSQLQAEGTPPRAIEKTLNHVMSKSFTDIDDVVGHVKKIGKLVDVSEKTIGILKALIKLSL